MIMTVVGSLFRPISKHHSHCLVIKCHGINAVTNLVVDGDTFIGSIAADARLSGYTNRHRPNRDLVRGRRTLKEVVRGLTRAS